MASKGRKLSLTSYDDIFKDDITRAEEQKERVVELQLEELHPFQNHPFRECAKISDSMVREYNRD